jgi:hypothetical protein
MPRGAIWLGQVIAGPAIWAATFTLVYALHGIGCGHGWVAVATPAGSLHRLAMTLGWGAGLAGCALLLRRFPTADTRARALPRIGAWVGLGATAVTLFPLLVLSTC